MTVRMPRRQVSLQYGISLLMLHWAAGACSAVVSHLVPTPRISGRPLAAHLPASRILTQNPLRKRTTAVYQHLPYQIRWSQQYSHVARGRAYGQSSQNSTMLEFSTKATNEAIFCISTTLNPRSLVAHGSYKPHLTRVRPQRHQLT